MKYVLLKLEDDAAEKLVKKANKRALGVWEVPEGYCSCALSTQRQAKNWKRDPQGSPRMVCVTCQLPGKPLTTLGERLRMAFMDRNIIRKYR